MKHKSRYQLFFTLAGLLVLIVSACGSPTQPFPSEITPTSVPPTLAPSQANSAGTTQDAPGEIPTAPSGHVRYEDGTSAEYLYRAPIQVPWGMVTGPDGLIYIADWTGKHVLRVREDGQLEDLMLWKTNPGIWDNDGPMHIAFDPSGTMYVGNHGSIFRFDEESRAEQLENVYGRPIGGMTFGPDGLLYYTSRKDNGTVFRWEAGTSTKIADGIDLAQDIAFGLDGTLYVSQMHQDSVVQVDAASGAIKPFISGGLGWDPIYLTVDPEGDVWVRGISVLLQFTPDGSKKTFIVLNNPDKQWHTAADVAFDSKGQLWVAAYNSTIFRLDPVSDGSDPAEFNVSSPFPGVMITDIAIGPTGEILVYNEASHEVWNFEPEDQAPYTVLASFDGNGAVAIAINEEGTVFLGLPWGQIAYLDDDNNPTPYAKLTTRSMRFGADGFLYAIVGDYNQSKTLMRITGVDTFEIAANKFAEEDIIGEAHLIPAPDEGFYIFSEHSRKLYHFSLNGEILFAADFTDMGGGSGPAPLAIAPDGTIYYIPHGPYRLYRINLEGEREDWLGGIFGDPYGMVISPDGKWLYIGESGAINKLRISD